MKARFVGGTWNDRVEDVADTAVYLVAVPPEPEMGSVDDFRIINIDEVWNGRAAKAKFRVQHYRRTAYDRATETATYELERTE